jgi:hypothetical protein
MSIATAACRRPLATILANCHQTAAVLSRDCGDCGLLTPAAKLLGNWRQAWFWEPPQPVTEMPAVDGAAAANVDAATLPESVRKQAQISSASGLLAEAVKQLRTPGAIGSTRDAFELVVDVMHRGVGLKRVAALLVRAASGELQTVLSKGAEQAPALRQFRYASRNNQLFTQLLSKPLCLRLSAENRAKFWSHLPTEFRAAIDCDQFLLMGIFTGERATALLYADNMYADNRGTDPGDGDALDDRQQQLFKQLCQQLSACLTQLTAKQ